ncbi:NUDIX domain-containing protein [Candidatus Woesearchaeota archaeon]|jgi:ADP-ribose pyrophosphatase YjhB (NUDIX family)|nr:NUDIX domain-containing protein [Candidatus Woesearchaeota archaeon]
MVYSLDIVVASLIVEKDKILLIHHKKLNKWLPPGGHIEKNETPDEAVKREIKEEINSELELISYKKPFDFKGNNLVFPFYINKHLIKEDHYHYCLYYLGKLKDNNIKIEKNEILNYKWIKEKELQNFISNQDLELLNLCKKAINFFS